MTEPEEPAEAAPAAPAAAAAPQAAPAKKKFVPSGPPEKLIPRRLLLGVIAAAAVLGTSMGIGLAVVFGAYKVPAGSMWPTVTVGERVFANRYAKQPDRGSIIVFRYPERREHSFVKRVVGLPGDRIAVARGGELSINGWSVPRCNVGRASFRSGDPSEAQKHEGMVVVEFIGRATYLVFEEETLGAVTDAESQEWKVAAGEYFVLGDNRKNSHDSRTWFGGKGGGVPTGDVVGVVYGRDEVRLPQGEGTDGLAPGLAACLAKRPAQTDPPPPK